MSLYHISIYDGSAYSGLKPGQDMVDELTKPSVEYDTIKLEIAV